MKMRVVLVHYEFLNESFMAKLDKIEYSQIIRNIIERAVKGLKNKRAPLLGDLSAKFAQCK